MYILGWKILERLSNIDRGRGIEIFWQFWTDCYRITLSDKKISSDHMLKPTLRNQNLAESLGKGYEVSTALTVWEFENWMKFSFPSISAYLIYATPLNYNKIYKQL